MQLLKIKIKIKIKKKRRKSEEDSRMDVLFGKHTIHTRHESSKKKNALRIKKAKSFANMSCLSNWINRWRRDDSAGIKKKKKRKGAKERTFGGRR